MEADFARFYGIDLGAMLYTGPGVPLRRIVNLMSTLPAEAKIFDALDLADVARWSIDRELATSQLELLDVIARKHTMVKKPLINPRIRPADRKAAKPVSMSDPKARTFFGGAVHYTPRDKPADPAAELVTLGGGWYQLPDGSKVQGRDKALDKLTGAASGT